MKRLIEKKIKNWAESEARKPLVLRGARQVGKTWLLKDFGQNFKNAVYISFDRADAPLSAFENKDPKRIISQLEMAYGIKIRPGETFLILDEIQQCPNALGALKYFCEDMPNLHVAAAGSLLGTLLAKPMSYPVGKVCFLDVYPMGFDEFLNACDPAAHAVLNWLEPLEKVDESLHLKLLDAYHNYLIVGGMPECVAAFAAGSTSEEIGLMQNDILALYEGDFSKHVSSAEASRILLVWRSLAAQLAKENGKFLYGAVREGAKSREYELAIEWLVSAGLVNRVMNVSKPETPLRAFERRECFKLYLEDTGLLRCMAGIPRENIIFKSDYQFKGPFVENYVFQSLWPQMEVEPHYYSVKNSHEIDCLLQYKGETLPVEIKGGEVLKAKSLANYVKKHGPRVAIRLSERNFQVDGPLRSIPLYFLPRIFECLE